MKNTTEGMRSPWESRTLRHIVSAAIITGAIAAAFVLMFLFSAFALEQSSQCDGDTLIEIINITGLDPVYTVCDWGCDANLKQCAPHPIVQYAVFGGVALGAVGLFSWLAKR